MKKKIWITLAIVTLFVSILAGCSTAKPKPPLATGTNPPAAVSGVLSPAATLFPPQLLSASPPATDNADSSSAMLQSGLPLEISQPIDAATLTTETVTVKGRTLPGAIVSVNNQTGTADGQGNFNIPVNLEDGIDAIDVIATDNNGNQGEILLMVNVDLSQDSSSISGNNASASSGNSQNLIPLIIITPVDGADINGNAVTVAGQTVPGATVSINDQADFADDNGYFSIPISLSAGPNVIDIVSIDDDGNQNEGFLMVNRVSGS